MSPPAQNPRLPEPLHQNEANIIRLRRFRKDLRKSVDHLRGEAVQRFRAVERNFKKWSPGFSEYVS